MSCDDISSPNSYSSSYRFRFFMSAQWPTKSGLGQQHFSHQEVANPKQLRPRPKKNKARTFMSQIDTEKEQKMKLPQTGSRSCLFVLCPSDPTVEH
jgi:hypothetical protein